MYISYFDKVTTQILNRSQSCEFAKIRNQPKNRGFGAVRFFDEAEPRVGTVEVRFQPGPGTNGQFGTVANTRETAVARQQVQDAQTAIMQGLNDMTTDENMGATTGKPRTII